MLYLRVGFRIPALILTLGTLASAWTAPGALIERSWTEPGPIPAGIVDSNLRPLDGFRLDEGKVYREVSGLRTELHSRVEITPNIFLTPDGEVYQQTRLLWRLQPGQLLGQDGAVIQPDGRVTYAIEHLIRRGSAVYRVQGAEEQPLLEETVLPDGTRVGTNGRIVQPNGSASYLEDGQILAGQGTELQAWDSVSLRGGKVILYKDGGLQELPVGRSMVMSEGTVVWGDGRVIRRASISGSAEVTFQLSEGSVLKLDGAINERRLFGAPRKRE